MIPPRAALFIHDLGFELYAEQQLERARRDRSQRSLHSSPPRPHQVPCDCAECRRWAIDVVASRPLPTDGKR